jgi:voltage-gated potassium channel
VTWFLLALILFSIVLFTFETEQSLSLPFSPYIATLNFVIALLFAAEYGLRLWSCKENPLYSGKWGRIKFMFSYMAIIDLIAFLPALLFFGAINTYWLRLFRIFRILSLLKLGRYSKSLKTVVNSIKKSWRELVVTFGLALFFLYLSAVLLYFVESDTQPEAFGSIPRAMWWAVATLTTVGYGDVYPITVIGRICAGLVALIGVAIVALPAGILAGGFIEEYKARRESETKPK